MMIMRNDDEDKHDDDDLAYTYVRKKLWGL